MNASIIRIMEMVGGSRRKEKSKAPITKSIWSTKGKNEPGESPILRFRNAPARSPVNAPIERKMPRKGL